jgi:hypothetical protein
MTATLAPGATADFKSMKKRDAAKADAGDSDDDRHFSDVHDLLLEGIPGTLPAQRAKLLSIVGVDSKTARLTPVRSAAVVPAFLPFFVAHGDPHQQFDFGTLFSVTPQKVRGCGPCDRAVPLQCRSRRHVGRGPASRVCAQLHEPIWAQLGAVVVEIVSDPAFSEKCAAYASFGASTDGGDASPSTEDQLRFLHGVAVCASRVLEDMTSTRGDDAAGAGAARDPPPCAMFMQAAEALHGAMYYMMGPEGTAAQAAIATLCEAVWHAKLPGCEAVVAALLPYVLLQTLLPEGVRDADVKRVHGLRSALELLDTEDDSFSTIKEFLLLAFRSPVYLKLGEGRRFLSFALTLDAALVPEIHNVIKSNLPGVPARVVDAYAEIYFRAWRTATGATVRPSRARTHTHAHAHAHTRTHTRYDCVALTPSPPIRANQPPCTHTRSSQTNGSGIAH